MNRNISDFHLPCTNFSWERWVDFLKPQAGRFQPVLFLRSWQRADSPSQISENSEESGAGCSCELRFWQASTESGWVEWNGNAWSAAQDPKSTEASCERATAKGLRKAVCGALTAEMGTEGVGKWGLLEWVTLHEPARFPQLRKVLFININYQFSIWAWQVPGIYKQNSFNNFMSGIHSSGAFVYSPGSAYNAHLCDKWVGWPKNLLVNLELKKWLWHRHDLLQLLHLFGRPKL